jgi:hypothetical protein
MLIFLSIPLACSPFISSNAHCLAYQELLQTRCAQTSKSSRIRFGNFAKNLAKVLTPLAWIAQKNQHHALYFKKAWL